jgi:hypothetical protein
LKSDCARTTASAIACLASSWARWHAPEREYLARRFGVTAILQPRSIRRRSDRRAQRHESNYLRAVSLPKRASQLAFLLSQSVGLPIPGGNESVRPPHVPNTTASVRLAQLLHEHHGVPNKSRLPRLTVPMVLRFADAWHRRTGEWPTSQSGAIPEMPGLTWRAVNLALHQGLRGLPGGGSLHLLLRQRRKISKRRSPKEEPEPRPKEARRMR